MKNKHQELVSKAKKNRLLAASAESLVCFFAVDQPLVSRLHSEGQQLWKAAAVCVLDPKIHAFLKRNDPKALEQLTKALTGEGVAR